MIICNHCGAPVPDRASFCGECGTPNPFVSGTPPPRPYPPGPPPGPHNAKKSNAVLLLIVFGAIILGGVGLWALAVSGSRGKTDVDVSIATPTNTRGNYNSSSIPNTNYNRNTNYNSSNVNRANTNYNANYNGVGQTPYERVESKIRSQSYLTNADLSGFNCWELRLLRNTFFAQYGRVFDEPEIQIYFDAKSWYTRNDYYTSNNQDPGITPTDKASIEVVKWAEDRQSCKRGK